MIRDDLAQKNDEGRRKVSDVLFHLGNDFGYIEVMLGSWFVKHPPSRSIREEEAAKFCTMIQRFEDLTGSTLPSRDRFENLVRSDVREDWDIVFRQVLPKLRNEILRSQQEALTSVHVPIPPAWADLLPASFADQVLPLFRTGQYLSAVRRGCDALRALIRAKTGLHHLDGADLINQAYGKDRPFAIAVLEGHSDDDVQRGYADMLRGAMMGIRNPYYHGTEEIIELEAARLLAMLGTLWARASTTRPQ